MVDDKQRPGFWSVEQQGASAHELEQTTNSNLPAGASITAAQLAELIFHALITRRDMASSDKAANCLMMHKEELPPELRCVSSEKIDAALHIVNDTINAAIAEHNTTSENMVVAGNDLYDDSTVLFDHDNDSIFGLSFDDGIDSEEILNTLDTLKAGIAAALHKRAGEPAQQVEAQSAETSKAIENEPMEPQLITVTELAKRIAGYVAEHSELEDLPPEADSDDFMMKIPLIELTSKLGIGDLYDADTVKKALNAYANAVSTYLYTTNPDYAEIGCTGDAMLLAMNMVSPKTVMFLRFPDSLDPDQVLKDLENHLPDFTRLIEKSGRYYGQDGSAAIGSPTKH
jgi:hypothetical protein